MGNEVKFGKIKIYGKVIDLDATSVEELKKIKKVLDNRLDQLVEKYFVINE
ncbi:MAG: hypothetical protein J6J60_05455 [Clostridia bacterium]|nr:hypothetical protein [Clostridia bacterium]